MTYVLGLQMPGFNAIIADQRVTRGDSGTNDRIKTGVLFRGCMYARIGDERQSARLIRAATERIGAANYSNIQDGWAHLMALAENFAYSDDDDEDFTLLLSSRASGTPRFYELRSREGILPWPEDGMGIRAYGSGTDILNDYIAGRGPGELPYPMGMGFIERIEQAHNKMLADGMPPDQVAYITPYMLCLWLSELSINYELARLEAWGVGGMFYHLFQTPTYEAAPYPAVYIFTRPQIANGRGRLYFAWFRTAQAGNGLYVERFISAGFDSYTPNDMVDKRLIIDVVSRPDLEGPYDEAALYAEVDQELKDQPYAYFVGVGQYQPDHRTQAAFFLPATGNRNEVLDTEGRFTPYVIERVQEGYPGIDFGNTS
jgi:hypothetical protein